MHDYLEPKYRGTNSSISKWKVDCREEKRTWLNSTDYSQSMGRGTIIFELSPNIINYPKPTSINYVVMKFVCNY